MTTHGRFKDPTIFKAKLVFPDPLEPAIPIILRNISQFDHSGRRGNNSNQISLRQDNGHEYPPMEGCNGVAFRYNRRATQ